MQTKKEQEKSKFWLDQRESTTRGIMKSHADNVNPRLKLT